MRTRRRKDQEPAQAPAQAVPSAGEVGSKLADSLADRPAEESGKAPSLPVAWGNVVTDIRGIGDPSELARRLRSELELGEEARTTYGRVLEALDRSASNLELSVRLVRVAKLAEETYTNETNIRLEVFRSSALADLMVEYRAKDRASPTKSDIEDRMVRNWPSEYTAIKTRLAELHAAVRSLEGLRDAWASRCADIRIMADKARPTY